MRTAALLLCALASTALAEPPPSPSQGWDGRLPPAQSFQPQGPAQPATPPPPGYFTGYGTAYGPPIVLLPPPLYGVPLCPDRAPPYLAGGFKPRGPYTAWHGSALPLSPQVAHGYGYGPRDPYAPDPRDCAPAQSWNGDEGRARPYYIPPGTRR